VTQRQIADAIKIGRAQRRLLPDEPSSCEALARAHQALYTLLKQRFASFLAFGTNDGSADDLLQELCIKMVAAIDEDRIEDLDALVPYARGMARKIKSRAIYQQFGRMRKVVSIEAYQHRGANRDREVSSVELRSHGDPERGAIEREEAAELAGVFQAILAELDPLDRSLIERFYFRGQDAECIQAELGLGPGQFRMKMHRLRARLKSDYERIQRLTPNDGPKAA
jgi:RNA polymerase sigma factor (sigma-70 family)